MQQERFRPSLSFAGSLGVHVAAAVLLGLVWRQAVQHSVVARALPGDPHGERAMLTYSLGAPTSAQASQEPPSPVHRTPPPPPTKPIPAALAPPPPAAPSVASDKGSGSSGASAFGDDDLRIALPQFHPRPAPDLSGLAPGVSGNVVVDIVIDAKGKVTEETLVKGLGGSIDRTVLATVGTWTFSPATRKGEVVASQQEVLIHYERPWSTPLIPPSPS